MRSHPTLDKLQTLRLHGMLKALAEQLKAADIDSLSVEERLGLLVDRKLTECDEKRLSSCLHQARLRHNASLEDLDYRSPCGLDKALILQRRPVATRWPQPDHRRPHRRGPNLAGNPSIDLGVAAML